jgi:hypothetical protein
MVAVATLIALIALVIEPLCASMFILKNTWWGPNRELPGFPLVDNGIIVYWSSVAFNVTNFASISLNEGPDFQDLTGNPNYLFRLQKINLGCVRAAFLSAAGYASSSVLFNFGDPPFTYDVYTIAPFQVNCSLNLMGCHFLVDGLFRSHPQMEASMAQQLLIRLPSRRTPTAILW